MATSNYQFVPAYYEWHFINKDGKVLLNWVEPAENLYFEYDEEGEELDEPRLMTDIDEVLMECESYINFGNMAFNEGETHYNGVCKDDFAELPKNAADIMAQALYNYYIA